MEAYTKNLCFSYPQTNFPAGFDLILTFQTTITDHVVRSFSVLMSYAEIWVWDNAAVDIPLTYDGNILNGYYAWVTPAGMPIAGDNLNMTVAGNWQQQGMLLNFKRQYFFNPGILIQSNVIQVNLYAKVSANYVPVGQLVYYAFLNMQLGFGVKLKDVPDPDKYIQPPA